MISTKLKWLTGILEVMLAIPILGWTMVWGLTFFPVIFMFCLHSITLFFSIREKRKKGGSISGMCASVFAFIPFVGWALHVLTAILLIKDARYSAMLDAQQRHREWEREQEKEKEARKLELQERYYEQMKETYNRKANDILSNYRNCDLAVDTNILMNKYEVSLLFYLAKYGKHFYMSRIVYDELDHLKVHKEPEQRKKAQQAFDFIEELQRKNLLTIITPPDRQFMSTHGLGEKNDDVIVATYLKIYLEGKKNLLFLSNDKGARVLARQVKLPVYDMYE